MSRGERPPIPAQFVADVAGIILKHGEVAADGHGGHGAAWLDGLRRDSQSLGDVARSGERSQFLQEVLGQVRERS